MQGKHCFFVDELINRNMSEERGEMNEQEIKRYLLSTVSR